MEYYLIIKRDEVLIHTTTWMNLESVCQMKETSDKTIYDSTYIKCPEEKNYKEIKWINSCAGFGN